MIKVSVMYPNKPGARFDHAYYRDKHMPLVKARMGDSCGFYTVDKGLAGFGPHAQEILADIPNTRTRHPSFRSAKSSLVNPEKARRSGR